MKTTIYRQTFGATLSGSAPVFEIPDLRGIGFVAALAINMGLWAAIGTAVWALLY